MRSREKIERELTRKRERLALYQKREEEMLNGGVQLYTIGSRNLQRYQTPLSEIKSEIEKLEKEIDALEAELAGGSARHAVGVVPRDW